MTKPEKNRKNIDEYITTWMGSTPSIIVHTVIFFSFLTSPLYSSISFDSVLLILTTIVSLEAIYLALFIQISINRQTKVIGEVSEDIEEIQEDVEEVHEHVEEVSKEVGELSEDIEEISSDVEEIQQDMDEQEKEEEVEEKEEEQEEEKENKRKEEQKIRLEKIEQTLEALLKEIGNIKR
jgi:uncharacterized membrane protein